MMALIHSYSHICPWFTVTMLHATTKISVSTLQFRIFSPVNYTAPYNVVWQLVDIHISERVCYGCFGTTPYQHICYPEPNSTWRYQPRMVG